MRTLPLQPVLTLLSQIATENEMKCGITITECYFAKILYRAFDIN